MTSTARTDPGARSSVAPAWVVLALVCGCQFVVILDVSIVNVAIPSIRRDLGFTPTGVAWVVNGYLLTFAGLMLIGGRAADVLGHRRVLCTGLLVFSTSSLLAGLATAPGVLVGARVAQGVGAAMLAPATLAVLNTAFTDERGRAKAFGAWAAAGGLGGMAGAIAGGILTSYLSWRWIFLINVPIGTVLASLAIISLARTRGVGRESVDLVGAGTATLGLAALVFGVMQSSEHSWFSTAVAGPVAGGLIILAIFLVVEARLAKQPMIPLHLLKIRGVALGNVMLLLFGGTAIAMWYFTSLFMQEVLGYDALGAGFGQTPAAILFVLVARWASSALPRLGARRLVLLGCGWLVVGFAWLAQSDADTSYLWSVLGPTLLVATGIGLTFPTLMGVATAAIPDDAAGAVGGLANTASQVGGSLGLALLATVAGSQSGSGIDSSVMATTPSGYSNVFYVAAGFALAIAAVSALLPPQRSRQLRVQRNGEG